MNRGYILIAANPKSGAVDGLPRAEKLRQLLVQDGWSVEYTTDLNTVQKRSRELIEQGELTSVVAAGGDGTISAIINRVGNQVPITLLPIGSENLLAKYLQVPSKPEAIVEMLRDYRVRSLDLFRANDRMFLLMASIGFDADVVRRVHQTRRSHITRWAYRWSILKAVVTYRWPAMRLRAIDELGQWQDYGRCHWIFGFNVPKYAAGISILPDAQIDDGLIDVGMFRGGNLLRGIWNYVLVFFGRHRSSSAWTELRTRGVEIVLDGQENGEGQGGVSYQLDGDWVGDVVRAEGIGAEGIGAEGIGAEGSDAEGSDAEGSDAEGTCVTKLEIRSIGVAAKILVPRA
jgi:diacylglycerol kinase family enzyme